MFKIKKYNSYLIEDKKSPYMKTTDDDKEFVSDIFTYFSDRGYKIEFENNREDWYVGFGLRVYTNEGEESIHYSFSNGKFIDLVEHNIKSLEIQLKFWKIFNDIIIPILAGKNLEVIFISQEDYPKEHYLLRISKMKIGQ